MVDARFDVVVFDLDGTLVDTSGDIAAALNVALVAEGRPALDRLTVVGMVGHGARSLMERALVATGGSDPAAVDRGLAAMLDHYAAGVTRDSHPFPGVTDALDALIATGCRLALCTNKLEALARTLVAELGWADRFAAIIGGDTLPVLKPDPAPLHEAIARAGGGRAAYVGDSITDAETAHAASVPFVAVSFGFRDRPVADFAAAAVVDRFDQLPGALAALARLAEAPR